MANEFESFLDIAGRETEKVFTDIFSSSGVTIVDGTIGPLYPQIAVIFNLVANVVLVVEQKFSALGIQKGTGVQKFAQVNDIVNSTVVAFLATNKINGNVQQIINSVVSFLNSFGPQTTTSK